MVTTAVKNHPSNRASFDRTARTHRSVSLYIPFRMTQASGRGTAEGWRKSDMEAGATW
ncbi:hypothetical protein [Streptomyces europaeiscabiei]|uniref:hypothetical protein n=1 Tax=Streptomyces europaeiscabiei TaxID=146819 RepID=UPI001F0947FD|nr:hypothetical protein [Streptomyces europaeiscabiei]